MNRITCPKSYVILFHCTYTVHSTVLFHYNVPCYLIYSPSDTDPPVEHGTSPSQQSSKSYLAQLKAKYDKSGQSTLQDPNTEPTVAAVESSPDRDNLSRQRLPSNSPGGSEGRTLSASSEPGEGGSEAPGQPERGGGGGGGGGHSRKRRRKSRNIGPTLPPQLASELEVRM